MHTLKLNLSGPVRNLQQSRHFGQKCLQRYKAKHNSPAISLSTWPRFNMAVQTFLIIKVIRKDISVIVHTIKPIKIILHCTAKIAFLQRIGFRIRSLSYFACVYKFDVFYRFCFKFRIIIIRIRRTLFSHCFTQRCGLVSCAILHEGLNE